MIPKNKLPPLLQNLIQSGEEVLSIFQNSLSHHIHYLITNLRIINCTNKNNIQSYFYAFIYKIEVGREMYAGKILLHSQPMLDLNSRPEDLNRIIFLNNISNPPDSKRIIEDAWFDESPFGRRKKHFEQLAKKHGLNFLPITLHGNKIIQFTGFVDDMAIFFHINNVYRFGRMHLRISVPNPEDNYLSIKREKPLDAIAKLFGKQDIITNSKAFDERFLLQSDHQKFFDFVMTEEIKNKLMEASSYIDGSIFFGLQKEKEKAKKKNNETQFDILDEHLLDELLPETKLDDDLVSPLVFQCNNIRKNLSNIDIMISHSIATFEAVLEMAKRIKEYSEK